MQLCSQCLPLLFRLSHLFAGEFSRKRKEEDSFAVLISKEKMWAQFQKCWSEILSLLSRPLNLPKDCSGSSSSCLAHHVSLARSPSACLPSLESAARLASPSILASPDPSLRHSIPAHHL